MEKQAARPGRAVDNKPEAVVDREKVCPLLLRVFTKVGEHHRYVLVSIKTTSLIKNAITGQKNSKEGERNRRTRSKFTLG